MNPLSKLLIGALVVGLMTALLPIADLLEVFAWAVIVPLIFLLALGLLSEGTYETIRLVVGGGFSEYLRKSIDYWRAQLKGEPVEKPEALL